MKYFKYVFLFLFFVSCKKHQTKFVKSDITPSVIDSLNSEKAVEEFARKIRYPILKKFNRKTEDVSFNFLEKFELKKIKDLDRDSRFDIDSLTKIIADSLQITESFYKTDIDNNGFTDLILIGDNKGCIGSNLKPNSSRSCDFSIYSFMNFGNDSIKPILIARRLHSSLVPKISEINALPVLEIHIPAKFDWLNKKKYLQKKLFN